jgi:hypothetical protein
MSGPNPKHGQALEADLEDEALVASGPPPKHGAAAALSVGPVGAIADSDVEPGSGSPDVNV